ncbi:hypothetical protein Adt_12510 [Abeliophyllum distichum]|uniref:Uncharacterized protein n=1 Tax=Abeliophyllum distichum TaxID=126358 RepID=A0ABD1UQX6_9LAMI
MDEDELFYVNAIPQQPQQSSKCKFEILFIVNPSQRKVRRDKDKDKGKTLAEDISPADVIPADIQLTEPPAKRSLFHSDDAHVATKKKFEKFGNSNNKKNQ